MRFLCLLCPVLLDIITSFGLRPALPSRNDSSHSSDDHPKRLLHRLWVTWTIKDFTDFGPDTYPAWRPSPARYLRTSRACWCPWTRPMWGEGCEHEEWTRRGGKVLHGAWEDVNHIAFEFSIPQKLSNIVLGQRTHSSLLTSPCPVRAGARERQPLWETVVAGVDFRILQCLDTHSTTAFRRSPA